MFNVWLPAVLESRAKGEGDQAIRSALTEFVLYSGLPRTTRARTQRHSAPYNPHENHRPPPLRHEQLGQLTFPLKPPARGGGRGRRRRGQCGFVEAETSETADESEWWCCASQAEARLVCMVPLANPRLGQMTLRSGYEEALRVRPLASPRRRPIRCELAAAEVPMVRHGLPHRS
jgi:hypothetical protein